MVIKQIVLQIESFETFILMTIIFFVVMVLLMMMSRQNTKPRILKPEIRTELICENCHTKIVREFKEGEHVSMRTGEECPRCKGPLKVNLIFSELPQQR